jgi:hypothetical protein
MSYVFAITISILLLLPHTQQALPYRTLESSYLQELSTQTMPIGARRILSQVIQGKAQTSEYLINEFWKDMADYAPFTDEIRRIIRDRLAGEAIVLGSYLYRDMLISIYIREYYESEIRKNYEAHLLNMGVITEKVIEMNKKSIEKYMVMDDHMEVAPREIKKTRSGLQSLITKMSILEKQVNRLFKIPDEIKKESPTIPEAIQKEYIRKDYRQGFLEDKTL